MSMKTLIYILLFVIGTQALVPEAAHGDHEQATPLEQLMDDAAHPGTADDEIEHCSQCHGFPVIPDIAPAFVPAPATCLPGLQPPPPQTPDSPPFRPPIG